MGTMHAATLNAGTQERRLYDYLTDPVRRGLWVSNWQISQALGMLAVSTHASAVNAQFARRGFEPPIRCERSTTFQGESRYSYRVPKGLYLNPARLMKVPVLDHSGDATEKVSLDSDGAEV